MHPDLSNRFLKFNLDEVESKVATSVSPYFFAHLQNKIASYADAVVEFTYTGKSQLELQTAVIEHERLKAYVEVLEELMRELTPPKEQSSDQSDIHTNPTGV